VVAPKRMQNRGGTSLSDVQELSLLLESGIAVLLSAWSSLEIQQADLPTAVIHGP
jgi:hypothetical protein